MPPGDYVLEVDTDAGTHRERVSVFGDDFEHVVELGG